LVASRAGVPRSGWDDPSMIDALSERMRAALGALICLVALCAGGQARAALPAATASASCNGGTVVSDQWRCAAGTGALSTVTLSPDASVTATATTPGGATYNAFAALRYYFEVVGGKAGDAVPLLIGVSSNTAVDNPRHYASASVYVDLNFNLIFNNMLCAGLNCPLASSFSGDIPMTAYSGSVYRITLNIAAESYGPASGGARAAVDPYIHVDTAFATAAAYGVVVSDGVANAPTAAVPEPPQIALWLAGVALLASMARSRATRRR
jgi:hypothetical protein